MQYDADAIFDAAIQLPENDRLDLVSRLLETLPEGSVTMSLDDPELRAEIERRFADQAGAVPWADLRAEG